jgi:large subunit ribosomal protein L21
MYAIVEIAGRQYKVQENSFLVVNRLNAEEGSSIEFDKVLFVGGNAVKIGNPTVAGAKISCTVEGHGQGDKVLVFKKKRRKGYAKKNGFRHALTRLKINKITA